MIKPLLLFVLLLHLLSNQTVFSQVINAYARVTNISGTTLTLTSVNEAFHSFNVGDKAILIQIQGDVIGTNTADNASFGDLASIGSVGLYEIVTITNKSLPTIQVNSITNSYNTCSNCRVQLVSFRKLGSPNYTTTSNMSALDWDGEIGGILALEVPGILTLNHNITADGAGFRGGNRSIDYYDWTTNCYATPYRADDNRHGFKGEGIYNTNGVATYNNARAKILNGGGGGNHINAGGGGGGNFTAGGRGGPGWNGTAAGCPVTTGGYGYGGIALSSVINHTRVFMGGGGGGGQQNNTAATAGGDGGGIIFIKANQLVTTGSCASRIISANGLNASNTVGGGNDGAGGGGAGGTIILQIDNYSLISSCPLTVQANGGNGGTVNSNTHGGGGAGGQGAIFATVPSQPSNSNFQTLNGNPGCNNNSNPCNNIAGAASGTNNMGIFFLGHGTPLPVHFWNFEAYLVQTNPSFVTLSWQNDNNYKSGKFKILKSFDLQNWFPLYDNIQTDNNNQITTYEKLDYQLKSKNYYQLVFEDINGNFTYSEIQEVFFHNPFNVYPNPFEKELFIERASSIGWVEVYNEIGQTVFKDYIHHSKFSIPTHQWPSGIYFIQLISGQEIETYKTIKP